MMQMQHLALARKISIYFTLLVYLSGIIGMHTDWRPWFVSMTPFTLLLSVGVLLLHQPIHTPRTHTWLLGAYLVGFFAEVIGVNTGLIFGDYTYTSVLGPMAWNTPFMIGVNWVLVTYVVNECLWRVLPSGTSVFWGAVLGALGCTLLDYLVEPGAISLGYWSWAAGLPPLENYVGWFFVSLIISLLYAKNMSAGLRNAAAPILLALQVLFFAIVR